MKNEFSSSTPWQVPLTAGLFLSILIFLSLIGKEEVFLPLLQPAAPAGAALSPIPELSAEAYLVRFTKNPVPLAARRSWKRVAPASLTKIMAVLVARERIAPDETITFSPDAKAVEEKVSDAAIGESFARDDAIRMALVASANDAALALAEAVGKKFGRPTFTDRVEFFVRLMNTKARILGLDDTHFENPVGLDAPRHFMSATDLGRLVAYVEERDPALLAMTRDITTEVFSVEAKKHTMANTNELLKEFPALGGGKTGMTDNAKGTLLLLYPVRPDHTAVIVILKSEDRFGDGRKIIQWLEENFY